MFKTSDHDQICLDYVIGRHEYYMGLPMASSRIRVRNELLMIGRYIATLV